MYTNIHKAFMTWCSCWTAYQSPDEADIWLEDFLWPWLNPKTCQRTEHLCRLWKFAALLRVKHVDISALDVLFSFQEIRFSWRHCCLNIPQYDLFIALRLDQFCCSFFFFFFFLRSLHNHSLDARVFFYEHWDSFRDWKINEQINYADHETFERSSAWLIV